ncbi:MAG: AmmeMemoRadiSam system protein B [Anaerolineales bacterium]
MDLRPSIAGSWYPADRDRLRQSLERMFDSIDNPPQLEGRLQALVVPHAGHRYSGQVAAHGFAQVRGLDPKPDRVLILGPLHQYRQSPLLTSQHDAYQTPLGKVPVDRLLVDRIADRLRETWQLDLVPIRQDSEHSIEVELPFLQWVLGDFAFVPLMISDQRKEIVQRLAHAIVWALDGESALIVASSDLSHYYPQHAANTLDREMLRRMERLDPSSVLQAEQEGVGFACGKGAIAASLWASMERGAEHAQVMDYATSGDVSGDYSAVVGYASVAISGTSGQ